MKYGVKIAWKWFLHKKCDIIVATTTAWAIMTTQWICGEFDAESCGIVETVAQ